MDGFSTKQKGDIAEYRVITHLLIQGANVLEPIGDRLPYDIAVDQGGRLVRIQVKSAWYHASSDAWRVEVRRSQTNRSVYKYTKYVATDFDFLVAWLPALDIFYIFPSSVACSFGSGITMVESSKRQRAPKSASYRGRWDLISSTHGGCPYKHVCQSGAAR
jgi:hypothetical protein